MGVLSFFSVQPQRGIKLKCDILSCFLQCYLLGFDVDDFGICCEILANGNNVCFICVAFLYKCLRGGFSIRRDDGSTQVIYRRGQNSRFPAKGAKNVVINDSTVIR